MFGFSRQAFYQHKNRQLTTEECDQQVLALIEQIRKDHPRLGGKKLYELLKKELMERGIKMGRDALFDLLAANNLLIRKRKRRMITTFSRHRFRKYGTGHPAQSNQGYDYSSAKPSMAGPPSRWLI